MEKFFSINKTTKIIVIVFLVLGGFYYYNNISTAPIRKAFDKIFSYYLTGDCDKYSKSYNVSFSEEFINKFGDTDWLSDAIYQKQGGIANKCQNNIKGGKVLDVKIKEIIKENFSDTAFVQAEITAVNENGVHHIIPQSFIMKKISDSWFMSVYCDTENDQECK